MPRTCTICTHPERETIDLALMGNNPLRDIARQWRVSKDAVARHKADHIPIHLAKAEEAREVTTADDLLGQLLSLNRETITILREARTGKDKDNELALKAIARAEKQIELQARLLGELKDTTVNVLISPQWHELRAVLVHALIPYPQARIAVTEALGRLHAGA